MFHVKHPQRHNQPQHKNLTVKPTQKDPQQANHQKAVTHQSLFSRWKNPFMPTDDKPEIIRHLSYFSLLLKSSHACQCLETLNRISQQLNKIQKQCFTWNTTSSTTTRETVLKNYPQQLNHPTLRFTWNTNHQQLTEKKQRSQTTNPTVFHVEHDNSLNKLITPTTPTHVPRETKTRN